MLWISDNRTLEASASFFENIAIPYCMLIRGANRNPIIEMTANIEIIIHTMYAPFFLFL
jgi:hypothetical protein